MNPFLTQTLAYVVVFVLLFVIFNFLTRGFLLNYLKVKGSRGKKIFVKIRAPIEDYTVLGVPSEGTVKFKDRSGSEKRVCLPKEAIIRYLGVYWIEVDEESGSVATKDFSIVPGFDPAKIENLIVRALTRPPLSQKKDIIIYLGIGLVVILLIIVLFQINSLKELIGAMQSVRGGNI